MCALRPAPFALRPAPCALRYACGVVDTLNPHPLLPQADRLLDMGFEEEVNRILQFLPPPGKRQTLLFSATWGRDVEELSKRIQRTPEIVSDGTARGNDSGEGVGSLPGAAAQVDRALLRQWALLFAGGEETRSDALCHVLESAQPRTEHGEESRCLVFCETREQCEEVASLLVSRGASALAMHGGLEQSEREKVMIRFRNKSCRVLVATNVASRGLDIEGVSLVVCYQLSREPAVHVHRVGRTARADRSGEAVSLIASVSDKSWDGNGDTRGGDEVELLDAVDQALGGEPIPRQWFRQTSGGRRDVAGTLRAWAAEWQTVLVLGGRRDKLRAGDILGALSGAEVGLEGQQVGKIDVTEQRTWVAVRRSVAAQAARALNGVKIKKKRFKTHLIR